MSTNVLTKEEIQRRIDGITTDLKGPGIPTIERRLMHLDRQDLREMLKTAPSESEAQ